jgi:biotin--protein ligase
VNSTWSNNGTDYIQVIGIGLNVSNAHPTTSLNSLLNSSPYSSPGLGGTQTARLRDFDLPRLLARILTTFEDVYSAFLHHGFASELQTKVPDMQKLSNDPYKDRAEKSLEDRYYTHWLHTNQLVTLVDPDALAIDGHTKDGGGGEANTRAETLQIKARILGVTPDLGCLIAEEEKPGLEVFEGDLDGGLDGGLGGGFDGGFDGQSDPREGLGKRRWYLEPDGNSFDFWKGLISRKA